MMSSKSILWTDRIGETLPGPTRLRVRGTSMAPTLRPGDEVLLEPVGADALRPGDWVMLRSARGAFLHRYLGRRGDRVLTKGDGRWLFDPLWPPEAVLGRVTEAHREGRCIYRRTPARARREALAALGHRGAGALASVLRRFKALLPALLLLAWIVPHVWAAVTLASFTLDIEGGQILLEWETASETNNLGFYLDRSAGGPGDYQDISGFIPSEDEGAGAFYQYFDVDVTPGVEYHYRLRDLNTEGGGASYTPVPAFIVAPEAAATTPPPTTPPPTTAAPTVTPSLTPSPTATPQPTAGVGDPTATPEPYVNFWADPASLAAGSCSTVQWQAEGVQAVFLDGEGVSGQGARAYCPCETETHTLRVVYQDGSSEDLEVTLSVTGECGESTATPTPRPATPTPRPATATAGATPAPTATAPPRPAATATPASEEAEPTASPTAQQVAAAPDEGTPQPDESLPSATPSSATPPSSAPPSSATPLPTRPIVEGDPRLVDARAVSSIWLLIVGAIIGLGFIGGGVWLWRKQQ